MTVKDENGHLTGEEYFNRSGLNDHSACSLLQLFKKPPNFYPNKDLQKKSL